MALVRNMCDANALRCTRCYRPQSSTRHGWRARDSWMDARSVTVAWRRHAPAFSYVPGQPLERQVEWWARRDTGAVDVHGNQVALLERSRCFRSSLMTCATCHDVHRQQRDLVGFSDRCLTCHSAQSCGLFPRLGPGLVGRCVDCHMPALTSSTIVSTSLGRQMRVQVRTHWIKVYPQFRVP